jgi:DNA-binding PucR family transcriptional regulator
MDEVRATALLLEFAAAYANDPALVGGPVQELQAHDKEHRTSYTETLSAYLDAFGDIDGAARLLGVHANTVRYRLRQLSRFADLKLDDPSQRLALMLQLRLHKAATG